MGTKPDEHVPQSNLEGPEHVEHEESQATY